MFSIIDSVLYLALPYGGLVLGLVLTVRYLKLIDLTFAASFVLGPAIAAKLMIGGYGFGAGISIAVAATIGLAVFSLLLARYLELDHLLAGLLCSFAGFAITLLISQGTVSLSDTWTPFTPLKALDYQINAGSSPLHPWQVGAMLVIVGGCLLLVDRYLQSEHGLAFRSMEDQGSADFLLKSLGVSVEALRGTGVVAGNVLCMMSGVMVAFRENQVTAQRGFDALLTAIAAYLLGIGVFEMRPQTGLGGRVMKLIGSVARVRPSAAAVLGLVLYFVILETVARSDLPASVPKLIVVALIVGALSLSELPKLLGSVRDRRKNTTVLTGETSNFEVVDAVVGYAGFPDSIRVLNGAGIAVAPGELVHLMGANGIGKSTLLRFAAGLTEGSGVVKVPTTAVGSTKSLMRPALVGYLSQDASRATCATLPVMQHLALYQIGVNASPFRKWRQHAGDTSRIAGLAPSARETLVGNLSGGQRQVLGLAAFLVRPERPQTILLDEPLTHLDESNAAACVALIEELLRDGRRLVVVQHDLVGQEGGSDSARARLAALVTRKVELLPAASRGQIK